MNTKIFAYAAGYIDGDGCFYGCCWYNTFKEMFIETNIQICSVKIESLNFFKEQFGGSINAKPKRVYHKTVYIYKISGKKSLDLAINIQPYLTDKKMQCWQYIQLRSSIVPNCGKKVEQETINIRNNFMDELKKDKHERFHVTKEIVERLKDIDTIAPQEEDWAYLAGLIDAEGCFRIKKWKPANKPNYVYAIALEIGNTKYPMFEFLMEKFGGNIVYISPKNGKKPSATWSISSFTLSQVLPKIIPYLIIKKAAAEKLIEFYNTTLPNGGDRHSEEFKKLYAERLIERERIVDEIHKLNLKGLKI
jgi:hypothetical protein